MKKRSYINIEPLDLIAQQFIKEIASRVDKSWYSGNMTFCVPDFKGLRQSYMTILSKIIKNGGTMRRKDIIGQHKVLPEYGVYDYKKGVIRDRRPTELVDKDRGRASSSFTRLKCARLVVSDSNGYHITDDGRKYVEIMNQLSK